MFKKCMSLILVLVLALSATACVSSSPNVTELSENTVATNPGGDTGGVDPGATEATVPDVSEPEVSEPTGPEATEPTDPGPTDPAPTEPEPTDPADPSEPTEPADPTVPTEPVHEHSYSEEVTEPTCTENGFTTFTCECGDSYEAYPTVPTGHSWSDWVTTKEPTETATGTAQRTCADCGEKENRVLDKVIPDHTHSYTGKVTTAATCTKEGVKTFTCSCGGSYTEKISKISHSYKDTVTKPTCTEKGYTTHKCSACGDSYKDSYVAATGHSYGSYKSNGDATCTKDGTKTATCSKCGVKDTKADTGSATGHKYGSYTSNGDATCTKDGTKTATCFKCGVKDTKTDAGSAKGHSYTDTVTAPTCSSQGYTTHICSTCGDSYKDGYTSAANHSYMQTSSYLNLHHEMSSQYECTFCGAKYNEQVKLSDEELLAYYRKVGEATVKYINQFRVEQGDTEAISLPGLTLVAEYRAVQLQDNFEHSTADLREAYAYYEYGEWHDNTAYGGSQYWSANAKEAIARRGCSGNPDQMGKAFAEQFLRSKNHWAYVGSSDYTYIGVGVSYDLGGCYCCVLQTKNNYG